jgi:hypothetical protein
MSRAEAQGRGIRSWFDLALLYASGSWLRPKAALDSPWLPLSISFLLGRWFFLNHFGWEDAIIVSAGVVGRGATVESDDYGAN